LADFDLLSPAETNLRRAVDLQLAQGAQAFLDAFGQVNAQLDQLQSHLNAMNLCCKDISSKLESANTGTKHLLEQADGLRQQK
jgi:aspartate ammonia-lyase